MTAVSCAPIEACTRLLGQCLATSEAADGTFLPSLILTLPGILYQTWQELHSHFPKLDVHVYFASKCNFPNSIASVPTPTEFRQLITQLDPRDPKTGRTVIISTYPTFFAREVAKTERPILLLRKLERNPGRSSKRQKMGDDTASAVEQNEAGGYESVEEAIERATLAKANPAFTPRQYYQTDIDRLKLRVHLLPANHNVRPDGNLVVFKLRRPFMQETTFEHLLCDEAHIARRASTAWNKTIGVINAKNIAWITGGPMVSSLRDTIAPMQHAWDRLNIPIPNLAQVLERLGDLNGLYSPEYDPLCDEPRAYFDV